MFNFGKAKERASGFARSLSKQDDLERATLVAMSAVYADGEADPKELEVSRDLVISRFRSDKFTERDIAASLDNAERIFKAGRFTATAKLRQACEQVESAEESEGLFALAGDICAAAGDIGDKEMQHLRNLGNMLRVDLKQYGLA